MLQYQPLKLVHHLRHQLLRLHLSMLRLTPLLVLSKKTRIAILNSATTQNFRIFHQVSSLNQLPLRLLLLVRDLVVLKVA